MVATAHSRVKGLVTVAPLKSNYDAKRDHVEMFQPFLVDTLCSLDRDNFTVDEIRQRFFQRHGLAVPLSALQILLTRAKRKGLVRRDGGQYFRILSALTDPQLPQSRAEVDREHAAIATALREYAAERKRDIQTDEDALALLLAFLEENQIAFLLDDPGTFDLVAPSVLPQRDAIIVARFITEVCLRDPHLATYRSWMAVLLLAAFGVYRATWGGNLAQWRLSLQESIRRRLTAKLIPGSHL